MASSAAGAAEYYRRALLVMGRSKKVHHGDTEKAKNIKL
jgi:hypothetical protein